MALNVYALDYLSLKLNSSIQNHPLYFLFPEECVGVWRIIAIDKPRVSNIFLIRAEIELSKDRKVLKLSIFCTLPILSKRQSTSLVRAWRWRGSPTCWNRNGLTVWKGIIKPYLATNLLRAIMRNTRLKSEITKDFAIAAKISTRLSKCFSDQLVCFKFYFFTVMFYFVKKFSSKRRYTVTAITPKWKSLCVDFNAQGRLMDIFWKKVWR